MAKYTNSLKSYEIFDDFMNNCLVEDRSLLWPEKEAWTLDNLHKIKENFIDNPIIGGEFWDKIFKQFSTLDDGCWRILADAFLIYTLPFTYMNPEKKFEYIDKICKKKGFDLPVFTDEKWDVLNQGFTRTAMRYHQKYRQLWLIFLFAIEIKKREDRKKIIRNDVKVREILYKVTEEEIKDKRDRSYGMINAILHLGYPEKYERIISKTHKQNIVNEFNNLIDREIKEEGNIDDKLYSIRTSLEQEYKDKEFDFYLQSVKEKWQKKKDERKKEDENYINAEDPTLDNLVRTLRRHKQIILYGPPGTGKTYYAEKLAKEVLSQDNFDKDYNELNKKERQQLKIGFTPDENSNKNNYLRFCTFHPAYGYEEFIEGYRPYITEEGRPAYKLKNGIFKRMCKEAEENKDKTFILIIDEINRGDIPRIFGELIRLIETGKRWQLDKDYPDTAVILLASEEVFAVPDNIILIGTMNTADQSIALLDVALRRRFGFRELLPESDILKNRNISGINLADWLNVLNKRISKNVGRNLQVGHSYLMKNDEPIKNEDQLLATVRDEILPLLQEYCYDDYSALKEILGPKIVKVEQGGFDPEIFTSKGSDIIIEAMKDMISGVE